MVEDMEWVELPWCMRTSRDSKRMRGNLSELVCFWIIFHSEMKKGGNRHKTKPNRDACQKQGKTAMHNRSLSEATTQLLYLLKESTQEKIITEQNLEILWIQVYNAHLWYSGVFGNVERKTRPWSDRPHRLVQQWPQTTYQSPIQTGISGEQPEGTPWLVQSSKRLDWKSTSFLEVLPQWSGEWLKEQSRGNPSHGSNQPTCGWPLPRRSSQETECVHAPDNFFQEHSFSDHCKEWPFWGCLTLAQVCLAMKNLQQQKRFCEGFIQEDFVI